MAKPSEPTNSETVERESVESRLRDYLDGYFLSFDFYPVCERQLFAKNDAYALLQDFWAIGGDVNRATQRLVSGHGIGKSAKTAITSSESALHSDQIESDDDIEQRKIQAAQKALEAIERSKPRSR